MPTILSISDIIELGKVSTYLSANYVDKSGLFKGGAVIKPTPPDLIAMSWYALEWGQDSGAWSNASLRKTGNYCYWIYGKFQLEAQRIINGSAGGGSVVPTPANVLIPNPYDWRVGTITTGDAPLKEGDTTVTLDGTNGTRDFRGYNVEFYRGGQPDYTTNPQDGSVFYSWNRTTGVFTLLNGAAQLDEPMRITPVLGLVTEVPTADPTTITYNLVANTVITNPVNNNLVIQIIITPNGFSYTWDTDFVFSDNWPEQSGATAVDTIQIYTWAKINSRWICVGQSLNIPTGTPSQQLSAPVSLTPTVISDTEIDLTWDSVTDATNYVLQRAEQSDYSDAVEIYSGALTSFNDTGLTGGTTYYYRVKAQATGFTDSDWTTASATTSAAVTTSDLTFTTNTNLLNTSQVFTANGGGGGFGHTGLDVLFLAANQNGRIYCYMQAGDSSDFVFGFNTANAQTGFNGMEIAFDRQVTTLELFRFQSGALYDTLNTIANGLWFGLFRVGALYKAQTSPDGLTWTDYTPFLFGQYSDASAIAVYPVCDLSGPAVMYTPKIDIYGSGNLAMAFFQDGDSIAAGFFSGSNYTSTNIGYQGYAALQAVSETFYKSIAVSGSNYATRMAALATDLFPLLGQVNNSYDKIIVAINCGVNDLAGDTAANVYTAMINYRDTLLAQDSRISLMLYTVINCDPAYVADAKRLAYNALVLGTTQTARFKIVDISSEPLLNNSNAYLNATYYQADGIHLTQAGYDLLYSLANSTLLSF